MTQSKNILVVGGAGYIGSHCCKVLSQNGYTPVVYDNFVYGHREFVKWGPLVEGDLGDKNRLADAFLTYQPEAVFHFAGYINVGESVTNPSKYYENNVVKSISLLDSMVEHNVRNLVFSSTCAIYGYPDSIPMTEAESRKPVNPYGKTKLMFEQILEDYDLAYNLKSVCLRYFNACGADGEVGEDHRPETHLIPIVLDAAMGKREAITINGTDYPTPDGSCVRDYIHVLDLAEAHILALKFLQKHQKSEGFNLGNGKGYSVKEVIDAAKRVTQKEILVKLGERREGDPPELVGSSKKAEEVLGWSPKWKNLDEIVASAWAWHQSRFK